MTSAAVGSAHHHPSAELRPMPARVVSDSHQPSSVAARFAAAELETSCIKRRNQMKYLYQGRAKPA